VTLKLGIRPNVYGGKVTTYQVFARLERDGAEPIDFGGNLDGSATLSKEELRGLRAALFFDPFVRVVVDGDVAVFQAEGNMILGREGQ
jgi:hypothetical protein